MARFTWYDATVLVEYDDGASEQFSIGQVVTRNVPNYKNEPVRWIGVITSAWDAGRKLQVTEFTQSYGTAYDFKTTELSEEDIVDTDLMVLTDYLSITTAFGRFQAAMTDRVFNARRALEVAENELDLVVAIFAPIRFEASEEHRADRISTIQSANAIISDLVAHGALPPTEALAEARAEAERMFPEEES